MILSFKVATPLPIRRSRQPSTPARNEADVDLDFADVGGRVGHRRDWPPCARYFAHREIAAAGWSCGGPTGRDQPAVADHLQSGMRYGWCSALSRLCTRLVINTVLPARLKPVTARLTMSRWRVRRDRARLRASPKEPSGTVEHRLIEHAFRHWCDIALRHL